MPRTDDDCLGDDDIAQLVEGRLDAARLASFERHLSSCSTCPGLVAAVAGAVESSRASHRADAGPAGANVNPAAALKAGARVGRYQVLELLGVGGMGSVYAALDPSLDRRVALKLVRHGRGGPELEARLLREAKSMAKLSHPEVISVFDVGTHGDQLFIAMELVEGGTLRQWLEAERRSFREVLAIFLRAGRGLEKAHAVGIIHRDFKPDNVLVGDDGRVRVTDFGLARVASVDELVSGVKETAGAPQAELDAAPVDETSLTKTGLLVGTPAYMAPENVEGAPADVRSDVYCFCVALYEGLYGQRPFAGASAREVFAHKRDFVLRAAPAKTDVPLSLRKVVLEGLAPDPARRPASMTALLARLERAARPPGTTRRLAIASAITVTITAAIAVAAAAAVPLVRTWRASQRPSPGSSATSSSSGPTTGAPSCLPHLCVEAHGGAAYTCRPDGAGCAAIASMDCVAHYEPGDLGADDVVWIGAIFPTKGPLAEDFGQMNAQGVELARSEVAHATSSLVGPGAARHVRPIGLVTCDDSEDPMRAAKHLVDDVGAPAILGFASGQEVVDLAGSLLVKRNVVSLATLSASPLVTRIPQLPGTPRLVWRTTFSLDQISAATAAFVHSTIEPKLPVATAQQPHRIVLAHGKSAGGLSFAEQVAKNLVFNDKPALENGDAWRELEFPPAPKADELGPVVDAALAARPNVVIFLGAGAAVEQLVTQIEARWPAGSPRPTYVVASDSLDRFAAFLGKSVERRRRLWAVESLSGSAPNARFVIRYNAAYATSVSHTINPGPSYDAFYLLAYATFALGDASAQAIDGRALAHAFERLQPPATKVEVGPTAVFDALSVLTTGGSVDLDGTQSALDLDPKTGEGPSDFALLCAQVDATGAANGQSLESGLVFDSAAKAVIGKVQCP